MSLIALAQILDMMRIKMIILLFRNCICITAKKQNQNQKKYGGLYEIIEYEKSVNQHFELI